MPPYSTIPITSGAAKFSTLDPDANLFLEENNITVGANPDNPATLYDYDTSTLTISNIQTNNGELNIHNSDLIGVKRFVCQDYLGAVRADASNNLTWELILDDIQGIDKYSKMFRVPSNFIESTVNLSGYFTNSFNGVKQAKIFSYDTTTETYTEIWPIDIPANTTTPTEISINNLTVNPNTLLSIGFDDTGVAGFYGSMGLKIYCDLSPVAGGYWEII